MVAENIRRLMARTGLTIRDVVSQTGLNERTVKSLLSGSKKPHARTLHRLADGLGVDTDELFRGTVDSAVAGFDRETNPVVHHVLDRQPELFEDWTDAELDELFSRFGTGGELTQAGVVAAAEGMNRRRTVLDQVAVLMETEQADLLADFVEMLYRRAVDVGA